MFWWRAARTFASGAPRIWLGNRITTPATDPSAFTTAFRNGSLQGAYLMIAARMLGLAAGPMSGFDAAKLNAEFFPDGRFKANFLVNLGYGDPASLFPRSPRLSFDEACSMPWPQLEHRLPVDRQLRLQSRLHSLQLLLHSLVQSLQLSLHAWPALSPHCSPKGWQLWRPKWPHAAAQPALPPYTMRTMASRSTASDTM